MSWLSIFKRKPGRADPVPPSVATGDAVQQARVRARRRLIGAVVLVAIGIIGFPLIFESQPRPLPLDIPIDIPRKDQAPPLAMPAARTAPVASAPSASAPVVAQADLPPSAPAASQGASVITETPADAGRELPVAAAASVPKPAAAASRPSPAVAPVASAPVARPPADAARAQALLEDKSDAKGRFVVQAGAYADAAAASQARAKLEKLGLKTYTQVAETASGPRTRVRVGPFTSRAEADQAKAKAAAAGLTAVVLTL